MKKRGAFALIITLIAGVGINISNFTGTDYKLLDGTEIPTEKLDEHLSKKYRTRSIENVPLTLYLHHTATSKKASIEAINNIHLNNDWPRVSYHFAVDDDGDIYYLNDLDKLTWHTKGKNTKGISVVLIGNFETDDVSKSMEKSTRELVNIICEKLDLNIVAIKGHRDVRATLCPGEDAMETFNDLFFDAAQL